MRQRHDSKRHEASGRRSVPNTYEAATALVSDLCERSGTVARQRAWPTWLAVETTGSAQLTRIDHRKPGRSGQASGDVPGHESCVIFSFIWLTVLPFWRAVDRKSPLAISAIYLLIVDAVCMGCAPGAHEAR